MSAEQDTTSNATLRSYRLLSLVFNTALIGLALSGRSRKKFQRPLSLPDLAMTAAATHKIALIVSGERVARPLRAPFAEDNERPGVKDTPRGEGLQRAVGELLTCPYCLAPWVSTVLVAGHVFAPEPTRMVTTVFSAVAASDWLSQAHTSLRTDREAERAKKRLLEQEAERLQRGELPKTAVHVLTPDARA